MTNVRMFLILHCKTLNSRESEKGCIFRVSKTRDNHETNTLHKRILTKLQFRTITFRKVMFWGMEISNLMKMIQSQEIGHSEDEKRCDFFVFPS